MTERIGFASIDANLGGISAEICHEFDGETYTYFIEVAVFHHWQSSKTRIVIGTSTEPPIEFIDELVSSLRKTKLHMLNNKYKGNVHCEGAPPQG